MRACSSPNNPTERHTSIGYSSFTLRTISASRFVPATVGPRPDITMQYRVAPLFAAASASARISCSLFIAYLRMGALESLFCEQ